MNIETIKKKARPFLAEGIKLQRELNQVRAEQHRIQFRIQKWKERLNDTFATDALDFSIVSCDAYVGGCVYTPSFYRGVGKRNCIFCGKDDFDF